MNSTNPASSSSSRPSSRARSAHARQKVKERNASMQYRDCSIFNATRHKEQEDNKLLKTQQQLDKQSNIFANEVRKLKDRQSKLASAQKRMCMTAMQKYSVYLIQALYRGHHDRQLCRRLRSIRFLRHYLPRRYCFRRRAKASRRIISAYRRYVFFQKIHHFHILFHKAIKIQRCYRAYYRLRRAVVRRFTMITWKHVALFAVCRATQAISPLAKQKRIIYRAFTNFYARLRRKRLACHFNSYRLFYGIFFAEAPIVKRHLQSRASSIVGKRSRVFEGNSRQSIVRNINIEVLSLKIARAPINVYRKVEAAATHITLQHFRSHVIADQMKQMQHMNRRPSMVIPSPRNQAAVRTNGSFRNRSSIGPSPRSTLLSHHRASLINGSPASRAAYNMAGNSNPNNPTASSTSTSKGISSTAVPPRTKSGIALSSPPPPQPLTPRNAQTRKRTVVNVLNSITEGEGVRNEIPLPSDLPTFDDVFNDYVFPKQLMKYRSTSQIDSNSMFANSKIEGSDKLVPFELRGNYRLKTIADVVICLQDLAKVALKNPLVLQNPYDRKVPLEQKMNLLRGTKRDRSPRFIETCLPFNGTFQHSIFRRGASSYDFESSAVYNYLSNQALSSGKRALLRQHVIKSAAVHYEEERYQRRHFLNPMRKNQPSPPEFDIDTLDANFLKSFEQKSDSLKKKSMKKRRRVKKPKHVDGENTVQEQENMIRQKIMKLREDILQQQEIIGALNNSRSDDDDSDSDTSTSSTSSDENSSRSSTENSSCSGDMNSDLDDTSIPPPPTTTTLDQKTSEPPTFLVLPPQKPRPSFQRRRNVSLAHL